MTSFTKTLLALGLAVTGLSSVYANTNMPTQITQMLVGNDSVDTLTTVNGTETLKIDPNTEKSFPLLGISGNTKALKITFSGKDGLVSATCNINTGTGWYGNALLLNIGLNARIKPAFSHVSARQFNFSAKKYQEISCSSLYHARCNF